MNHKQVWRVGDTDLEARAAALGASMVSQRQPAQWLMRAARAAAATPVVLNCRGIDPDRAPVLVSLAELERLRGLAVQPGKESACTPAGLLRSTVEDALQGDAEAADWLRVMAPDLAENERTLEQWLDRQKLESVGEAALLDPLDGDPLAAEWERAGQLDHYLDTIHERATNP